jgi:aspartate racemase
MEAIAAALLKDRRRNVALIGTLTTMEHGFFQRYFHRQGIDTIVPKQDECRELDRIVWEELSHGQVLDESRARVRAMVAALIDGGAEAVVLACTELSMLIRSEDSAKPLYDTMALHADAILEYALAPS